MADETLLSEYTYCYSTVTASLATLNPLDPEDALVITDINTNVLPAIQTTYDNAVSSIAGYYNKIEENILKKASAYSTSTDYATTLTDGCNLIKDIRSGAIFAKIKSFVIKIATDGIKAVVSQLKQCALDAISDLTLMVDLSALDNLMRDVNMAAGACLAMISQGTAFLNSVSNCLEDTGLYNANMADGVTQIKALMVAGGGQITDKVAAAKSITAQIHATADIKGQATTMLNKLENASYKKLGI